MILFTVVTAFGINASAKEKKAWEYCSGAIKKVFVINESSKSNELLRIYDNGSYEHLKFTQKPSDKEEVERNLGRYLVNRSQITFSAPTTKEFSGKFRYGTFYYNGKIYESIFKMKIQPKKELFRTSKNKKFFKPFFICLNTDEVVCNNEAAEQIDLNRLMSYILVNKKSEEEKVMSIIQFVVSSIEYDYDGYYKDIYANKQNDVKSIIAGNKRLAVCAGYSYTVTELCGLVGINAEKVYGYTKQNFSDLSYLGGYHSWNLIQVDGKQKLYDVTWSDKNKTIDMRWIDVDPLVMIGSHFPDLSAHQLLPNPISQEQFLSAPVVKPLVGSANPVNLSLLARQFSGSNFRIVIPGKHIITVSTFPSEITQKVYKSEGAAQSTSYTEMNIGSGHFDGDSTYFIAPLAKQINPLEIEIDGQLQLKTVVFKGGQTDLMNYFISTVNRKQSVSYIKGVIAAIRLKDVKTLKELVGSYNPLFFDKKGKLIIDQKVTMACFDWVGDISSLIRSTGMSFDFKGDGTSIKTVEEKLYIQIPNKIQFTLDFNGEIYSVKEIELL